ncbi:MAG TPA: TraR/DksA family transcriptional regulator [Polaromonas sp.]|uniref:TraR/DksA family transcriptional regulator n=1 Tax=Polaromonas sp. TaxID=1869339 RepID=UPI002D3A45C9|nr:TraR/DksA family transcriptional regulator [Polaromonas sp.]HYW56629.1 TraR/DksA family transcriptional regulator [Polaromonas sp.]
MNTFSAGMEPSFTKRLAQREAELRHVLESANNLMREDSEAATHGVVDFKDVAATQSLATVEDVTAEHAARELEDVLAAQRRLADHSYGNCADCGEAIDLGRLMALAATRFCTACQTIHERDPRALRR